MAGELAHPVVVEFPLRGEGWVAVTSPADRIPSHGTDLLAQRYAYDFLIQDARRAYHRAGLLRTLLLGVPTKEAYAWGQPVHAPFIGQVVRAVDGVPERRRIQPVREALLALRNAATFTADRLPSMLGNHVIARNANVFAAFAHLATASVAVREGDHVRVGDVIGQVGHSGNSTSPHLHFQLMDDADPMIARPVPCAFDSYEVYRRGIWQPVRNGVPARGDRIRYRTLEAAT